ncbi:MAG: PAS domain S-box protein [Candidatus Saccharibacteria bacterium]
MDEIKKTNRITDKTTSRGKKAAVTKSADPSWLEAEDLYLSLIAEALFGYYVIQDYKFCFVNPKLCEIFGYSVEEMLEKEKLLDLVHPDDVEMIKREFLVRIAGEPGTTDIILRSFKKDGSIIYIHAHASLTMYKGRPAIHGNMIDISESISMIARLSESEQKLRLITDHMLDMIAQIDTGARFVYAGTSYKSVLGYDPEEILGKSVVDYVHPADRKRLLVAFEKSETTGQPGKIEIRFRHSDGHYVWLECSGNPIFTNEEFMGGVLACRDISERRETQRALKVSERNLRRQVEYLNTMIDNMNEVFFTYDVDMRVTFANRRAFSLTGYSPEEVIGRNFMEIVVPDEYVRVREKAEQRLTKGTSDSYEVKILSQDGDVWWVRLNSSPLLENGRIVGGMVLAEDITERKKAENDLANEKERLAVTLRSIGDGVITADVEGRVVLINAAAEKLTGWTQSEATGYPINKVLNLIDPHKKNKNSHPLDGLPVDAYVQLPDRKLLARDGIERTVAVSRAPIMDVEGSFIGTVLVFRDITETRKFEQELLKTSKIESLGVLAGGIAHDFNNLLMIILGNITLAKLYNGSDEKLLELLGESEKAALQAKSLTQQLLTFAKGGAPVKKVMSVAGLLRNSSTLALSGSTVMCSHEIPDDLYQVNIDEGQFSQVINNLMINALQAMPEGGSVSIKAKNTTLYPDNMMTLSSGEYVCIAIQDQGVGISKENLQKIFDPYFTTKPTGSGLGLATAYAIVNNHEGKILVSSDIDQGARFEIYLPAVIEESITEPSHAATPVSGRGRVLVVDDDPMILDTVGNMLAALGYQADLVNDDRKGVEKYRKAFKSGKPFAAVIMDLTVPGGMGGKKALQELRKVDSHAKVIVSSGYANDPIMAEYRKWGFDGVVPKPYGITELSRVLQEVLV